MITGGNLTKAQYIERLARALSSKARKPFKEEFRKLAKIKVDLGAYDEYKESIKKTSKAKAKKKSEE